MWYGCNLRILDCLLLFSMLRNGLSLNSVSVCYQLEDTMSDAAILLLSYSDVTLDGSVLRLCPRNVETLFISESSPGTVRHISSEVFTSVNLPNLQKLFIRVDRLKISGHSPKFYSRSNITVLSIVNCSLQFVPFGAFHSLSSLEHLDLSLNSLPELPPDLISHNPKLAAVNISHNDLVHLPQFRLSTSLNGISPRIDVSDNPLTCDCVNSWLSKQLNFIGLSPCVRDTPDCAPTLASRLEATNRYIDSTALVTSVVTGRSLNFSCLVNSSLPARIFWITPIGIIPPSPGFGNNTREYSYFVQPLLDPSIVLFIQSDMESSIKIKNIRGHLSGDWYCVCHSAVNILVSKPLQIKVRTSIFYADVYWISLYYGYGAMAVLMLVGVIGGTIRYCHETSCLRRPQPPFAYGGKTLIGVIPVPEVDDEGSIEKLNDVNVTYDIAEASVRYMSTNQMCAACLKPKTYWFCVACKAVHFAESVLHFSEVKLLITGTVPVGRLTTEGEIKLECPIITADTVCLSDPSSLQPITCDVRQPLIHSTTGCLASVPKNHSVFTSAATEVVYVRSGTCIVQIRCGYSDLVCSNDIFVPHTLQGVTEAICTHSKARPNSADVKLVVSNERLAEEYRNALEDLARAVESPDPARFREHLEEFRNRLRRDVGHGVKVLRGEFQDLRAKSAKGVANLRSQSSAAAQRVRAGISHGVEQVKGGMRSMAELCGASGTVGQTISVVSVYVDEADQTKKERIISDFVF